MADTDALMFEYRLDERMPLDHVAPRSLERWVVSVFVDAPVPGGERAEIGSANVLVITLASGQDIRDFTDPAAGTWIDRDNEAATEPASHLLVLDRVWLRPDHRGQGLGPIIAAAVIDRLGRGCDLAACYPAPFEGKCEPAERAASVEALGQIWAKAGFRLWSDGVWMLDPQQHESRMALGELITERGCSAPVG